MRLLRLTLPVSTLLGAGVEKNQRALLYFVYYNFIKIKYTYRKVHLFCTFIYIVNFHKLKFSQTHIKKLCNLDLDQEMEYYYSPPPISPSSNIPSLLPSSHYSPSGYHPPEITTLLTSWPYDFDVGMRLCPLDDLSDLQNQGSASRNI